jgi:hypothetical protein
MKKSFFPSLKIIYNHYLPSYQAKILNFQPHQLKILIKREADKAKKRYSNLRDPKIAPLNFYIEKWVEKKVSKDFVNKVLASGFEPPKFTFPIKIDEYEELIKEFWSIDPGKRPEFWKKHHITLEKLKKAFLRIVSYRKLSINTLYIELFKHKYKIPPKAYENFVKNKRKVIQKCKQNLPRIETLPSWFYSWFARPCFICQIDNFPLKNFEETINFVSARYPILKPFLNKIKISFGKEVVSKYEVENDTFQIILNKDVNIRHQIIELIHEFSHLVDYLESFKKGINPFKKGIYILEKKAFAREMKLEKELSFQLFQSMLAEFLLVIRTVLFEMRVYGGSNQNLDKLYAETFNLCFKKGRQTTNPTYILDRQIFMEPFSLLPHAVALANLLENE